MDNSKSVARGIDTISSSEYIHTLFAKPTWLSPMECSRYGWENVDVDILRCVSCKIHISGRMPASHNPKSYEECCVQLKESLLSGHRLACPWSSSPSPQYFLQLPHDTRPKAARNFSEYLQRLFKLGGQLPLVPESMLDTLNIDLHKLQQVVGTSYDLCTDVSSPEVQSAAIMAITGWTTSEAASNTSMIHCDICNRDIGVWNFLTLANPIDEVTKDEVDECCQEGGDQTANQPSQTLTGPNQNIMLVEGSKPLNQIPTVDGAEQSTQNLSGQTSSMAEPQSTSARALTPSTQTCAGGSDQLTPTPVVSSGNALSSNGSSQSSSKGLEPSSKTVMDIPEPLAQSHIDGPEPSTQNTTEVSVPSTLTSTEGLVVSTQTSMVGIEPSTGVSIKGSDPSSVSSAAIPAIADVPKPSIQTSVECSDPSVQTSTEGPVPSAKGVVVNSPKNDDQQCKGGDSLSTAMNSGCGDMLGIEDKASKGVADPVKDAVKRNGEVSGGSVQTAGLGQHGDHLGCVEQMETKQCGQVDTADSSLVTGTGSSVVEGEHDCADGTGSSVGEIGGKDDSIEKVVQKNVSEEQEAEEPPAKRQKRSEPAEPIRKRKRQKTCFLPLMEHHTWCPWVYQGDGRPGWQQVLHLLLPQLSPGNNASMPRRADMSSPEVLRSIRKLFNEWTSPVASR